jgi:DNA polymerase-3 subunit epsilon
MIGLFFDTETTGIKSDKNPSFKPTLVQIGAIMQDIESGRVLAEINLMNKLCGPIPVEASNVHGINQELAETMGFSLKGIDALFAAMIYKSDVIVAHNIAYDLDIVKDNMPTSHLALKGKDTFCTMIENIYVIKAPLSGAQQSYFATTGRKPEHPYKWPNLMQTFEHYFNKKFIGAHDAMADIRACRDIYFAMQTKPKEKK